MVRAFEHDRAEAEVGIQPAGESRRDQEIGAKCADRFSGLALGVGRSHPGQPYADVAQSSRPPLERRGFLAEREGDEDPGGPLGKIGVARPYVVAGGCFQPENGRWNGRFLSRGLK